MFGFRRLINTLTLCAAMALPTGQAVAQTSAAEISQQVEDDRGFITRFLEENLSGAGRTVTLSGFEGALSSRATFQSLTIADADGTWITLRNGAIQWNRSALLARRVEIAELSAEVIELPRLPAGEDTGPTPEARQFNLPTLPVGIRIEKLSVDRVEIGEAVFGEAAAVSVSGAMVLSGGEGEARLSVTRQDDKHGQFQLNAAFSNSSRVLRTDLVLDEAENGILANMIDLYGKPSLHATIQGEGPLSDFSADISLATDGQPRVTGQIGLTALQASDEQQAGTSFRVRLGGDVAALLPPANRAFFGDQAQLLVQGLLAEDGALSVPVMLIDTDALNLSGSFALNAQNAPQTATLLMTLGQDAGASQLPVRLPFGGEPTTVQSGRLSLAYDAAQGDGWTLEAHLGDVRQDAGSIATLDLDGAGRITLDNGALAGIDGRITFGATGIAPADPALARAIGNSLQGRTGFDWLPGNAVELLDFVFEGDDYGLSGDLMIDGLSSGITASAILDARYDDLSRLSGLAGRPVTGAADAEISGFVTLLSRAFDFEAHLRGRDITIDQPQADRLLAGTSTIFASARRDEDGFELRDLTVNAQRLTVDAQGLVTSASSNLTAQLRLLSLTDVDPALAGSLTAEAALTGAAGTRRLSLNGEAVDLATGVTALDGALQGRTTLAALAQETDGGFILDTLRLSNPQLTVDGNGNLTPGQMDAQLSLAMPDLAALGIGWSGNLEANGHVRDATDGREIALNGTGRDLRMGQQDVDGALTGTTLLTLNALQQPDGAVVLHGFGLTNDQMHANARGIWGEGRTDLTLDAAIQSLAAFGRGWRGAVAVNGNVVDEAAGRRIELSGTGTDLALGNDEVDRALRGETTLSLRALQTATGIQIEDATLFNDLASAEASGRVGAGVTDLQGSLRVDDLSALGRGWRGGFGLVGSVTDEGGAADGAEDGTGATRRFDLAGTAHDLALGGSPVDGLLAGTTTLTLRGTQAGGVITLDEAQVGNDQMSARASGVYGGGRTSVQAQAAIPSLRVMGPGYAGSVNLTGAMTEAGGGLRNIAIDGQARDLSLGQTQIDAALAGQTVLTVRATEQNGTVTIQQADVQNPRLSGQATGTIGGGRTDLSAELRAANIGFLGRGLRGSISAQGRVLDEGGATQVTASGQAVNLGVGQPEADRLLAGTTQFTLDATRRGQNLTLARLDLRNNQIGLTGSGDLASGIQVNARLSDLALVHGAFPGPATATGTIRRAGNDIGLDLALSGPGGTRAQVTGTARQDFSTLDLRASGTSDAAVANPFLRTRSVEGPVSFDLRVAGPPALESVTGRISIPNARLVDPRLGVRIDALRLDADFANGRIAVDGGGAVSAGGNLGVQGAITLAGARPVDMVITINDVVFRDPNLFTTNADGRVTITGTLEGGPLIAGTIRLSQTEVRIPSTGLGGAKDIPAIQHINDTQLERTTRAKAGLLPWPGRDSQAAGMSGPAATPPAVPARLDLLIEAPTQIFIRGRGVDAEMGGQLRLTGLASNMVPIGMFELIRGRVDLLGKRFDLTEGILEMQGSMIPVIRLVAQTTDGGFTAQIVIDGDARDPEITFSSIPDMPQEEVLSHLLFGRGLDTISPLQAAQLANAVAVLAGQGGEGIVSRLRESVGLDDLDLATDDEGNVTLRAGKYLSENVYTDVAVGADGTSTVTINLDITPELTARGSVDSGGTSALGIFYERDF